MKAHLFAAALLARLLLARLGKARLARAGLVLAGPVLACLVALAPPALAQDGTATMEQQTEAATDTGMNGGSGADAASMPHDPGKGAVTNLPIPRFVTLKGSQGNARRGPGLTHRIDWVFTREGMPLKVTAEYEHWRRVEDVDGAGGWIHYTLLSGVRSVLVTQDMAQAFSAPDQASDVVYQSELGVIGKLLSCVPDWCRVAVEGEKGWIRKSALWGVDPAEIYP
jgi:SH3-like domain-containing protein